MDWKRNRTHHVYYASGFNIGAGSALGVHANRMIECGRARTRTRDLGARMPCFYCSLLLYNKWVIVRITLCDGAGRRVVMTMSAFMTRIWKAVHEP